MKIGILRGGEENYDHSVERGGKYILHIFEKMPEHKAVDIFIDKDNAWHLSGVPTNPTQIFKAVDLVYNVAHPSFGKTLENFGVKVVGPSSLSFGLAHQRPLLQNYLKQAGVNMPRTVLLPAYQEDIDKNFDQYVLKKSREVFEKFGAPYIVRALNHNRQVGIHVARTYPELINAIRDVASHSESVLVEEMIGGKVLSVHTLANFKNQNIYALPMAGYKHQDKEKVLELAQALHKHLDAGPYLKSDFVVHPKRGIFCINIDLHPNLSNDSHFCKNCNAVGMNTGKVLEHFFQKT